MAEIAVASTLRDFVGVHSLITEMGIWDAAETRKIGISTDELIANYYSDLPQDLEDKFTQHRSAFLLAIQGGRSIGCVGFASLQPRTAEIHKLYVKPDYRKRGIGKSLLQEALRHIQELEYFRIMLETVKFQTSAISLYKSFGFAQCAAFHSVPDELRPITLFFQLDV